MLNRTALQVDFCVVGGGMAGLCAAIAAARNGARTILMQERPVLGGNASSEIRMWICGAHGPDNRETGILEEIALENLYHNPSKNFFVWDSLLYDFAKREKNLTLLLNCTCMDACVEEGIFSDGRTRRIRSITGYQMTTQTFYDITATFYADCSGDSILAPLTGAAFRLGRESASEFGEDTRVAVSDTVTMGNSCLIQGRETTRPVPFRPVGIATKLTEEHFRYRHPNLRNPGENFWYLELGGTKDTIREAEQIGEDLIALAIGTWAHIKRTPDYHAENWELDFLGFLPGKRESRRMVGEYLITERDIADDRQFEDTVAFGGWPLDDHFPEGFYCKGMMNTSIPTPAPYGIPYRALYSQNVENLYFAGRNISMTHTAMSSIRVMATCALMGQAVGTAAAVATIHQTTPHGVYCRHLAELQQRLTDADCFLPTQRRQVSELCRRTPVENGNDSLKNGEDRRHRIYGNEPCGVIVANGTPLTYRFDQPQWIDCLHITFDSDLNRNTLPGDNVERSHMTRSNTLLDSPMMTMPQTLCRAFTVTLLTEEGEVTLCHENQNLHRTYHLSVERSVLGLRLIPEENWGDSEKTAVLSFDFR